MAARSGQITITTAGTAQAGPSTPTGNAWAIKAHPDNTDTVWVGQDGADDVASTNGFPLDPGEGIVVQARALSELRFDADVSGEKFCWFQLS